MNQYESLGIREYLFYRSVACCWGWYTGMEMIEVVANDVNEAQSNRKEDHLEASDVFTRAKHPVTLKVR